jgi:ureidoacrylate peracid hydrolase
MTAVKIDFKTTALLLGDLQNDFIDAKGAYGRAGQTSPDIAALPGRLKPLVEPLRQKGGLVIATQFTLVAGRGGEPVISRHLKRLRPFLRAGDFASGSWGNATVDLLQPVDVAVEKVAYSAFYMSRLEWVLRKLGVTHLIVAGIVTNGGITSTVRDAHVRDMETTVLEDGCAAFVTADHIAAIQALRSISRVATIAGMMAEIDAA